MADPIESAQDYHRATSYVRYGIKGHALDFEHYPAQTKSYAFLKTIDFPKAQACDTLLTDLLLFPQGSVETLLQPDVRTLCAILYHAYGRKKSVQARGMAFHYRTVPSAGGLYPCHLYLMAQGVSGLETGLYYCDMIQERLGLIQSVDSDKSTLQPPAVSLFVTAQFYTSAWKYRDRAFRYMLLDAGHLIENCCLAFKAFGYAPFVHVDFEDDTISQVLSLDTAREVPLSVITLNRTLKLPVCSGPAAVSANPAPPRFSSSFLKTAYDAGHKKASPSPGQKTEDKKELEKGGPAISIPEPVPGQGTLSFSEAVERRRSSRNYQAASVSKESAVSLLAMAMGSGKAGAEEGLPETGLGVGICCERLDGIDDGFYLFSEKKSAFVLQRTGKFHRYLAQVCLDQHWMAKAAIQFVFMADLHQLELQWGARGYRYLLIEAGRIAQRIYLGAEEQELGCCAVGALYDREAQELFDLDQRTALFYVVTVGLI